MQDEVQVLQKRYIPTERNFESSRRNSLLQWRERGQNRGILHISEEVCLPLQVCGSGTKIRET